MLYLSKAINSLKPQASYSYEEEDYSTIKWNALEGTAPTLKQINDEIARIKAEEITQAAANATAKAALLAKLGITADEAKLLLG
jgi:hypothetical protein